MRKPLVVGNWKAHGNRAGVQVLLKELAAGSAHFADVEVAVLPPFVFVAEAQQALVNTPIRLGVQNISAEGEGAYTGEVTAGMVREFSCEYALIGHSERRTLYAETNEKVAAKFTQALEQRLKPIVCVGETLEEYNAGQTAAVIFSQLEAILGTSYGIQGLRNIVIAYEPVWAIGTGKSASPVTAQVVHARIRSHIAQLDQEIAESIRILYGGSIKPDNARALFTQPDIDGGLVGGASLQAKAFMDIIQSCSN